MTTTLNGHANGTAPFEVHHAPTWTWPRQDDPGRLRTVLDSSVRDTAVDGDKVIRLLTAGVVLAVAAFAAVVSYSHIFELGVHHGQDGTAARLLPLSVDGLIAAASLVMLHAARNKLDVPRLARFMLALGVAATVAANVEYGLPFGWLSAVVSAWPAVAFVGSVEMAVRFVRDARTVATPATVTGDMTGDDDGERSGQPGKNGGEGTGLAGSHDLSVAAVTAPDVTGDSGGDTDDKPPSASDKPAATAKAELEAQAAAEGVSVRTIQRRRAAAAKAKGSAT
jgi:hypothetical protein